MSLFNPRKSNVKILKHHRASSVYEQGRYLVVEMKASLKSKKGRQIARETALEILQAVGLSERSFETVEVEIDESKGAAAGQLSTDS